MSQQNIIGGQSKAKDQKLTRKLEIEEDSNIKQSMKQKNDQFEDDEQYSSQEFSSISSQKQNSSYQSQSDDDSSDDNSESDFVANQSGTQKGHGAGSENDDYDENDYKEFDEEGRPKGVLKLFEIIKGDLGEEQSHNFKMFYDMLSNQVKYCMSSYINDQQDEESNNSQGNQDQENNKKSKSLIDPNLLVSMILQQKEMLLNITAQQEKTTFNPVTSIQQSNKITQNESCQNNEQIDNQNSQLNIPEFAVKLRLKPKSKATKELVNGFKKNSLIQINTKSNKPLSIVFDYLSNKQFNVKNQQIVLHFDTNYYVSPNNSTTIFDIAKSILQDRDVSDQSQELVLNLQYDILSEQEASKLTKQQDLQNQQSYNNILSNYEAKQSKAQDDQDEDEDLSDSELLEMFTEVFGLMLLKKRQKQLRMKHHDKNASLPHPNNLLKKPKKFNKREIKKKSKEEQKQMQQTFYQAQRFPFDEYTQSMNFSMLSAFPNTNIEKVQTTLVGGIPQPMMQHYINPNSMGLGGGGELCTLNNNYYSSQHSAGQFGIYQKSSQQSPQKNFSMAPTKTPNQQVQVDKNELIQANPYFHSLIQKRAKTRQ